MSEQLGLFERPPQFADARLESVERVRLNRQCIEILRLMVGRREPISNTVLNATAYRYSARIYDLRKAGITIVIVERNKETGVNWYAFASDADRERARGYL